MSDAHAIAEVRDWVTRRLIESGIFGASEAMRRRNAIMDEFRRIPFDMAREIDRLREEVSDLKTSVVAFCGPFAVSHARDLGMPDGHLHPCHYDILAKAGARMDEFVRSEVPNA